MPTHGSSTTLSLAFVIPCLNEAQTLPAVLRKIRTLRETTYRERNTEIIVADNGSTDASVRIAQEMGARVVQCSTRGYGAALQCGIQSAHYEAIVFADADNTYDFLETPRLLTELERGADLVIGSRLRGTIHPDAMPFLHRYIGTPMLNFLIHVLYSRGQRVTDCNSGFRCVRRSRFLTWGVRSTGMEFASEMLVKALQSGAKIAEVPISLHPDHRDRQPHMHTWRDGMRHLLQILLGSPQFFSVVGLTIAGTSWVMTFLSLVLGPTWVGPVSIFGIHTMMFSLLGSHLGIAIWGIGLLLTAKTESRGGLYATLLGMREDRLFWSLCAFFLLCIGMLLSIVVNWGAHGFHSLALERPTLALITAASSGLILLSHIIAGHLIKRT